MATHKESDRRKECQAMDTCWLDVPEILRWVSPVVYNSKVATSHDPITHTNSLPNPPIMAITANPLLWFVSSHIYSDKSSISKRDIITIDICIPLKCMSLIKPTLHPVIPTATENTLPMQSFDWSQTWWRLQCWNIGRTVEMVCTRDYFKILFSVTQTSTCGLHYQLPIPTVMTHYEYHVYSIKSSP